MINNTLLAIVLIIIGLINLIGSLALAYSDKSIRGISMSSASGWFCAILFEVAYYFT